MEVGEDGKKIMKIKPRSPQKKSSGGSMYHTRADGKNPF
jgi:hypothetical protein